MKILIIHQFLWSHYKAKIYSELQKIVNQQTSDELIVLQTSINELTRAKLGKIDWSIHQYNVKLLFEEYYENISNWRRAKRMLYWVHKYKPDVVNISGYYEPAMNSVLFYCRLNGIKVIISIDSTEDDNPNVGWREAIKRFVVNRAHGFFCYGSKAAKYMLKLGAKSYQILLENNAVDNEKLANIYNHAILERAENKIKYMLRPYNFIYAGRLITLKNLDNLLVAYNGIENKDWGLIIVGDGSEEKNLKKYVADNQLEGVRFIEGQAWYNVPKFLALGDVFILPSYSEPWGLVVNEAMACGMPVIVSNKCGSAHDLVKVGENGYVFDPYDIEELKDVLKKFMENLDKIADFGTVSKSIIMKYSPSQVAQEMFDGFKKVMYEY